MQGIHFIFRKEYCRQDLLRFCRRHQENPERKVIIEVESDEIPQQCRLDHWDTGYTETCERLGQYLIDVNRLCRVLKTRFAERDDIQSEACTDDAMIQADKTYGSGTTITWCRLDTWEGDEWTGCYQLEQLCELNPRADAEKIRMLLRQMDLVFDIDFSK